MSARRTIVFVAIGLGVTSAIFAWHRMEVASADAVSYVAGVPYQESLIVDAYDTLSSIGFFRATAQRLTAGLNDDSARIEALMRWTHENVAPHVAGPTRLVTDQNYSIVRRGFAYCDQTNHVFATLATYAGYDAHLLFLWKDDGVSPRTSPHTVAEARVGGRWIVVDAWQGIVWRAPDGTLLTRMDATPELMDRFDYTRWGDKAEYFWNGTTFESFPYQSAGAFLDKVRRKLLSVPVIAPPAFTGPSVAGSSGPSNPADDTEPSAIPPAPGDAVREAYDLARRAQLEGRFSDAVIQYRALLSASLGTELTDSVRYFLGLSALRTGHAAEAIDAFNAALTANAETPWKLSILQYRAEARELIGDHSGAVADLRASGTTQAVLQLRAWDAYSSAGTRNWRHATSLRPVNRGRVNTMPRLKRSIRIAVPLPASFLF